MVKAKKAAAHKAAGAVFMGEGALKAAFSFKYLGVWFSADGDKVGGREARMEQAADRYRQMGNIWGVQLFENENEIMSLEIVPKRK